MNSETLKPCPFCGAPAEIEHGSDHHGKWFNLGCSRHWGHQRNPDHTNTCLAGRIFYTETDVPNAEAIAAWNTRADPIHTDDSELLTIAWMDGSHRSTKAHRDTITALQAENERLREALERIATVDMGGGFLGAQACQKVARAALEARND